MFREWLRLKASHGSNKIIVFLVGAECYVVADDAVDVVQLMGAEAGLVFGPHGCYWKCHASLKAFYLRKVEMAGRKIEYIQSDHRQVTRPEKVRQSPLGQERPICCTTGRVYLGESGMGTFWYDRRDRAVYMRDHCHRWLGHYCLNEEWPAQKSNVSVFLSIPAEDDQMPASVAMVD